MYNNQLKAVVLAAGKGTRLKCENVDLPKVMREALGRPLLYYVLSAIDFIEKKDTVIVVGYKREKIVDAFGGYTYVRQVEQQGTGHALMAAREALRGYDGEVLVCCGDMPLIKKETYESLVNTHFNEKNACTILSGTTTLPLPYGRILRDEKGGFLRMVEERDCDESQRAITELNSGVYLFQAASLLPALSELRSDNSQKEYYLTDVPAIMKEAGERIGICKRDLGEEIIGVNTIEQLAQVEKLLEERQ